MTGKDLLIGLSYVDEALLGEVLPGEARLDAALLGEARPDKICLDQSCRLASRRTAAVSGRTGGFMTHENGGRAGR